MEILEEEAAPSEEVQDQALPIQHSQGNPSSNVIYDTTEPHDAFGDLQALIMDQRKCLLEKAKSCEQVARAYQEQVTSAASVQTLLQTQIRKQEVKIEDLTSELLEGNERLKHKEEHLTAAMMEKFELQQQIVTMKADIQQQQDGAVREIELEQAWAKKWELRALQAEKQITEMQAEIDKQESEQQAWEKKWELRALQGEEAIRRMQAEIEKRESEQCKLQTKIRQHEEERRGHIKKQAEWLQKVRKFETANQKQRRELSQAREELQQRDRELQALREEIRAIELESLTAGPTTEILLGQMDGEIARLMQAREALKLQEKQTRKWQMRAALAGRGQPSFP